MILEAAGSCAWQSSLRNGHALVFSRASCSRPNLLGCTQHLLLATPEAELHHLGFAGLMAMQSSPCLHADGPTRVLCFSESRDQYARGTNEESVALLTKKLVRLDDRLKVGQH